MTIHELIEKTGFSRRTIYFYTQMELLPPPKGKGKSFEYSEEHLKRLQQIKKLQAMRYSLKEIRDMLAQPDFAMEELSNAQNYVTLHAKYALVKEDQAVAKTKESMTLWRRFKVGDVAELHLKWPVSEETVENLEKELKKIINKIKGELK